MIHRQEVLQLITAHQGQLRQLGVKSLQLFGSVAREQAHEKSDVDLLAEFDEATGFFEFFQIKHYLENILQCPVDLGTVEALKEHVRHPVMEESIIVF
jgi:uncharacterized protein